MNTLDQVTECENCGFLTAACCTLWQYEKKCCPDCTCSRRPVTTDRSREVTE